MDDPDLPGKRRGGVGVTGGRRRLSVRQRRDEIITATLELLSARPASQLSIDDIAEAAGASRALVYHYFRSKDLLYRAAVRSACDDLRSRLVLPDVHPFEQLRYAARIYLDFAEERSADFVALLRGVAQAGETDELAAIVEQTRQSLVDLIIDSVGVTNPSTMLRATLRGWVAMMEVVTLDWLDRRTLTRDQVRRLFMNQLGAVLVATAADDEELSEVFVRLVATAPAELLPPWVGAITDPRSAT